MEILTLLIFCVFLIVCILFDFSILYALVMGFFLFCGYGFFKGHSLKSLFLMGFSGIKTVKNILIIFMLIGVLTALWRAAGTLPFIISWSASLVNPSMFIFTVFLLNCLISVLTGTAFGTAATMGVITMTISNSIGMNPVFTGGAVMSGIFFGDRCSPVSTSALLTAELTKTDIFDNIKRMIKTAVVPFVLTCIIYLVLGYTAEVSAVNIDIKSIFEKSFELHWITVLPAVVIFGLSVCRIKVRTAMSASILTAFLIAVFYQKTELGELFWIIVKGYYSDDIVTGKMLNGGGIMSMFKVAVIVCISSSYGGIFEGVNLLLSLKNIIAKLSRKITPFGSVLVSSVGAGMIACNQTLAIILVNQLCRDVEKDNQTFAVDLENSVVVTAPLIPWSIAGAVPLASVGAPTSALWAACFLYILPLYTFAVKIFSLKFKK